MSDSVVMRTGKKINLRQFPDKLQCSAGLNKFKLLHMSALNNCWGSTDTKEMQGPLIHKPFYVHDVCLFVKFI